LSTLAALISGIVGSKSTQLPHIAAKVPNGSKPESRVKRFARWCDNAHIREEMYFLPYVDILLRHLALQTVVLVMDGSVVGRGCTALMLHVVYKGRALPLAWRVRQAPKGHFPEDLHIAVVYLRYADKYFGLLASRLRGVYQPVISTPDPFLGPHPHPLASICAYGAPQHHDHHISAVC